MQLGEGVPGGLVVFGGEGVYVFGGEVVFCHAVEEVADFVTEAAGCKGVVEYVGPGGSGCDALGVVGE